MVGEICVALDAECWLSMGWCIMCCGGWFFMYPGFSYVVDFGVVDVGVFGGIWEVCDV